MIFAACLLFLRQAHSKDIDGEFVVFSVGANTCTDYLASRRAGTASMEPYKQWLMGYLSAFNLIVVNTYDILGQRDYRHIIRWLDRYCSQNRKESFVNASAALTVSLYPERRNLAPNKQTEAKWNESGILFDEVEEGFVKPEEADEQ